MSATPRLDRFTPTSGQRATIAALREALRTPTDAPALLLVTGDPGSGKSALFADLLADGMDDAGLALGAITDAVAMHSDGRLLRGMIAAFDEAPAGRSGLELLTTLRAVFAARAADGRRPVLVIDGAEALTGSQLEIVRSLLMPIAADRDPAALQPAVVLLGRSEIRERIRRRRPLTQRCTHDLHLAAPARDDIARIMDSTPALAAGILTAAGQRGIAPLALANLIRRQAADHAATEATLQIVLQRLARSSAGSQAPADTVQTAMPFTPAPASRNGAGDVLQLSLLHAAGIEAGGDD